jgi:hypothetical protein
MMQYENRPSAADFIARDMLSMLDEYYPEGVGHETKVSVVIAYDSKLFLCENLAAQCFGWTKRAAFPSCAGILPVEAPITHYKIV